MVSREDRFAVKLSNLLSAVQSLIVHGTTVHREIPVFGAPFGMGVFVIGMIDEMRCDQETLNLAIVELKTRKSNCMPTSSQKMTHRLQLMLYKRLFDEMVNGCLTKEIISKHMKLNMTKVLGKGVLEHLQDRRVNTLSKLMDTLLKLLQAVPFISDLFLEYVYQEDGSVIGNIPVVYDESWVKSKLIRAFSYWKGDRQAVGVDIEDSWKCSYCPYSVACEWRAKLEQQMEKLAIETTKVETSSCERGEEEEEEKEGKANKMNSPLADNRDVESDQTADPQVSAQTG